jgi:hypothetical protein
MNGDLPPALENLVMDTKPGTVGQGFAPTPAGIEIVYRVR